MKAERAAGAGFLASVIRDARPAAASPTGQGFAPAASAIAPLVGAEGLPAIEIDPGSGAIAGGAVPGPVVEAAFAPRVVAAPQEVAGTAELPVAAMATPRVGEPSPPVGAPAAPEVGVAARSEDHGGQAASEAASIDRAPRSQHGPRSSRPDGALTAAAPDIVAADDVGAFDRSEGRDADEGADTAAPVMDEARGAGPATRQPSAPLPDTARGIAPDATPDATSRAPRDAGHGTGSRVGIAPGPAPRAQAGQARASLVEGTPVVSAPAVGDGARRERGGPSGARADGVEADEGPLTDAGAHRRRAPAPEATPARTTVAARAGAVPGHPPFGGAAVAPEPAFPVAPARAPGRASSARTPAQAAGMPRDVPAPSPGRGLDAAAPTIGDARSAPVAREPARAPSPEPWRTVAPAPPRLVIGHIEVIVEAPPAHAEPRPARATGGAPDVVSRRYLRRL